MRPFQWSSMQRIVAFSRDMTYSTTPIRPGINFSSEVYVGPWKGRSYLMKWWAKSFHYQSKRISNYERPLEVSVTEAGVVNRRGPRAMFISALVVVMTGLPSPVSFHLPMNLTILLQGRLNSRLQFFLVVIVEPDELEGLQTPGDGT